MDLSFIEDYSKNNRQWFEQYSSSRIYLGEEVKKKEGCR